MASMEHSNNSKLNISSKECENMAASRRKVTLLRAPLQTLYHFAFVVAEWTTSLLRYCLSHTLLMVLVVFSLSLFCIGKSINGAHSDLIDMIQSFVELAVWWIMLGVLSSIGLGTGLHTFVLYLGPYVAKVTMAAAECHSLNFPLEGPDAFICSDDNEVTADTISPVTFIQIFQHVMFVGFLWGIGTAVGELPPYFVSKAAAKAGQQSDELQRHRHTRQSCLDRVKELLFDVLQRYGFFAIIVCASVPNPLFDLAGVTCGHFGVPFATFFGATLLGKSVFKVAFQNSFVIAIFHQNNLEHLVIAIEQVLPKNICEKIDASLRQAKANFHRPLGLAREASPRTLLARSWDALLLFMIAFFLKSIIESSVQDRLKTIDEQKTRTMLAADKKKF